VTVPWNAPEAVPSPRDFAAILVEPIPANMGVVPPAPAFLETLRSEADRHGALLIFDEVITGFRVERGGAQEHFGVLPELTIMGKVIGGGLPAAAFGGSRELMERVAPAGDVYQAGTLSGNPLATAAAIATLRELNGAAYERLAATTEALANGLRDAAAEAGVTLTVQTAPGLLTPFFSDRAVRDYADAANADLEAYAVFARTLLDRGVYPPPSQFEAWFPSLAHTHEDIERTVAAAREAFTEVADGWEARARVWTPWSSPCGPTAAPWQSWSRATAATVAVGPARRSSPPPGRGQPAPPATTSFYWR
jgi:glutamate-1-semialdehyde 2,1-aminomutase